MTQRMEEVTEYRALCNVIEDRAISGANDLQSVADRLMREGQTQPVVINQQGTVLIGHGLVGAMRLLGWPRALCVVVK